MKLFLDTSVLLAACGSEKGASRELFRLAPLNEWTLMTTPYVLEETERNLPKLSAAADSAWQALKPNLVLRDDVLTLNQLAVFPVTKDRPVLFSALAWADVLLTLDRNDFMTLLGDEFYGLPVLKPGMFLERQRDAGVLRIP
ncbi:MAG: hypothetical protein FD138_4480 [Planctomycetota bacterium]|nr:MAG: hypothetical protein FD138_4480 [Planctomycetota bacterium]